MFQEKDPRILIRLVRANHQSRVVADNLINPDLYLAQSSLASGLFAPQACRRHIDCKTPYAHQAYMGWLEEQSRQRRAKIEVPYGDQRLVKPRCSQIFLRKNAQTAPRHFESMSDAYLKAVQLHITVKSASQRLEHPPFENRTCVRQHHAARDNRNRNSQNGSRNSPAPDS